MFTTQPDSSKEKPLKILAVLPALIPSTIILVVEPLMYLYKFKKIELRIRLEKLYVRASDLEWADLVIFCRNTDPKHGDILERLLTLNKPYIYELDDNFFELPLDTTDGQYHRAPEQIAQLLNYVKNASLVRVYSSLLEERIKRYTPNTKCVKAPVNLSSIPTIPPPDLMTQKVKIVYSTSRTIADDLSQVFVKDIIRIIKEFGGEIEFHFWGFIPEKLKDFPQVKFHRFISDYRKYMRKMYQQGYDIGLAPMKNDIFHNSKTNNKFREYAACWIAGIYSNSEIYTSSVTDGVTGLLVSNDDGGWYTAITRLIKDASLRKVIQAQSRAVVEAEYSLDNFVALLLSDINSVRNGFFRKESEALILDHTDKSVEGDLQGLSEQSKKFPKIFGLIYSVVTKIRRAVNKHGVFFVFRLAFDEAGRYIQYFLFSCKIKQISFSNWVDSFWPASRKK